MLLCKRTTFNPHPGAFVPLLVCIRDELFEWVFGRPNREQETRFPLFASCVCPYFWCVQCPGMVVSRDGALSGSNVSSLLPVFPLSLFKTSYRGQVLARVRSGGKGRGVVPVLTLCLEVISF